MYVTGYKFLVLDNAFIIHSGNHKTKNPEMWGRQLKDKRERKQKIVLWNKQSTEDLSRNLEIFKRI